MFTLSIEMQATAASQRELGRNAERAIAPRIAASSSRAIIDAISSGGRPIPLPSSLTVLAGRGRLPLRIRDSVL